MHQRSFGSVEYEHTKVKTRRQTFLERMDRLVPWAELGGRIAPVYPQRGRGRRPYPLRVMLRIHCLQLWFNLSDPGMEQELYDSRSMLEFAGLSLAEPIPDETTILHFRHLLERHQLGTALFATINAHLARRGLQVRAGTIVDSTIISAPSSTKNQARARDPEMHQTRKGRQWFFGMKLHIGTDARTGLVHSVHTTAAHVSDVTEAHRLLHGGETAAWGDAGYQGAEKRPEHAGVGVRWRVAMRPGRRRQLAPGGDAARAERRKASVRAKVEHPFLDVKRRFGYHTVRYRGLAKNHQRLALLLGFANLLRAAPQLAAPPAVA